MSFPYSNLLLRPQLVMLKTIYKLDFANLLSLHLFIALLSTISPWSTLSFYSAQAGILAGAET